MKKYLKFSLYGLLGLFAAYLGLCAFSPNHFTANRSISIAAAPSEVFAQVADYANWPKWSPWQKSDPAMTSELSGTAASVGHKTSWKSKKEGDGTQQIVEIKPDSYIKMGITIGPDPSMFYSQWFFEGDSTQTKVTWDMDSGPMPFLMRGMVTLANVEKTMQEYYDRGLTDLKKVVEEKQ